MIKGSIVALVTPMHENGKVNFDKLGELLEYHVNNQTDGIVILGTTAEAPTLTYEEEIEIVKYSVKKVNKRVKLIVGSGSNDTLTAINSSSNYAQLGVDALLVITPYYNKTNTQGMIRHFTEIADNVSIPIILYNVPSRTGCSIPLQALKVLAQHKNILGIKEASGNISYVAEVAKLCNDHFFLYSGNDDSILPVLSLGGVGVISVFANIAPRRVHQMVMDYLSGKHEDALKTQLEALDLINALFIETNPIPIKEAMNYLGYEVGPTRLPLYQMDEINKEKLILEIDKLKEWLQ